MSLETPGDGIRCDHCDAKWREDFEPVPFEGERLCFICANRKIDRYGVNIEYVHRGGAQVSYSNSKDAREKILPWAPDEMFGDGRDFDKVARRVLRRMKRGTNAKP